MDRTGHPDGSIEAQTETLIAWRERFTLQFNSISEICRPVIEAAIATLTCAFVGPTASFSHLAASRCFGRNAEYKVCWTEDDVFKKICNQEVMYGIIAIEDSTSGHYLSTLSQLTKRNLRVHRRIVLPTHWCLIGRGDIKSLKRIYGHRSSFKQIKKALDQLRAEGFHVKEFNITTQTDVTEEINRNPECAVLANPLLAKIWGLKIIRDHMEDHSNNITTFALIGKSGNPLKNAQSWRKILESRYQQSA